MVEVSLRSGAWMLCMPELGEINLQRLHISGSSMVSTHAKFFLRLSVFLNPMTDQGEQRFTVFART